MMNNKNNKKFTFISVLWSDSDDFSHILLVDDELCFFGKDFPVLNIDNFYVLAYLQLYLVFYQNKPL